MKQLKNNSAILNIFKDDAEFVEDFVRHHAPMVKHLVMLNTGNKETYDIVKKLAEEYANVIVSYQEYFAVDFGKFRNDCLDFAKKEVDCEYFIWIDTDERLEIDEDKQETMVLDADVFHVERIDSSNRFATYIDRIYRSNVKGRWTKIIHEHFALETNVKWEFAHGLRINHLTSEAARPMEKKRLYYSLLTRQLVEAEKNEHRQGIIDSVQHMIPMASHDFKNAELCVQLYETYSTLLFSLTEADEISEVQKLNILVHTLMSFSRLKQDTPAILVNEIFKIDKSKSTYFQVMRAMVFNEKNKEQIKHMYEVEYPELGEPRPQFNNRDYTVKKEIAWFEDKLYE